MTSTRRVGGPEVAPGAVPVRGHAVQFFRDPLAFLRSAQQSGDVVAVRLGPTRAYLVCAPDLVQHVLRNLRVFDKGGSVYDAFRATVGQGVGACPFEPHRRKRHLVQPAFRRSRIARYGAMMSEQVAALAGRAGAGRSCCSTRTRTWPTACTGRSPRSSATGRPGTTTSRGSTTPAAAVPQGAWIPFGAGNRKCIGDVFATVEATIAVATITRRWRLSSVGPRPKPVPRGELGTGRLRMAVGGSGAQ